MKSCSLTLLLVVIGLVSARDFYYEVPFRGEEALIADLDLALGEVELRAAEEPEYLFQAEVSIEDEKERLKPRFTHETRNRQAFVSLDLETSGGDLPLRDVSVRDLRWRIYLGTRVPVELDLKLALARGDLDFTDIPLRALNLETGASKTHLRFRAPNPVPMRVLHIEAGASQFTAEGLGYSRAHHILFEGGLGKFTLDFTGEALPPGAEVEIQTGMAALDIFLPKDRQPIILELPESLLFRAEIPVGFTKQARGRWYNAYVTDPDRALRFTIEGGIGVVRFY